MPTRLRVITNSELKTRRRCAREHHISYELGFRSIEEAAALRFGTVIHLGLEAWWRAWPREHRLTAALAALPLDLDPFELARATEMLSGYDLRWSEELLEVLVLPGKRVLVEAEFRAPLVNPATSQLSRTFELGGRIDVLVLNQVDGRVYIVEHKTSSLDITAGSPYWRRLQLDTQVSTYYSGARALGFEPAGVIYDVLAKPKLKPLEATAIAERKYTKDGRLYARMRELDESPEEYQARVREDIAANPDRYFVRGHVVRFDTEERDAMYDAWQEARQIREAELHQRWPRNPDACERYGRFCPYFDVCTGVASLDDTSKFRKVTNTHEELTAPEDTHEPSATGSTPTTH